MKTKAAVLYEMAAPQPYAESAPLVIDDVTLAPPGAGEVLVEIAGAGLCHSDLSVLDGSRPRVMPMVLGDERRSLIEVDRLKVQAHRSASSSPIRSTRYVIMAVNCATYGASPLDTLKQ